MIDVQKLKLSPLTQTRDLHEIEKATGNLYQSLVIVSKRANQISTQITEELREKLQAFASSADTLEEVHENAEQIEISRFYEQLPKSTLVALQEFLDGKVYYRFPDEEKNKEKTLTS